MPKTHDWHEMIDLASRLLLKRTGENVAAWNRRIEREKIPDEASLRKWLSRQGVSGYAQDLLVWERFGYPDYMLASANALIDAQYEGLPALRFVYEALIDAASGLGEVTVQARKTYVSLLTPRRTFARIQPQGKEAVILALRLEGLEAGGRLEPSKVNESTPLQVRLSSPKEFDDEVMAWLRTAYSQNL